MAIDTAADRSSVINPALMWLRSLPFPDGSMIQEDRQAVPGYYTDILAANQPDEETEDQRMSAINVGSPWRGIFPIPDPDLEPLDQEDRQMVAFMYGGILAVSTEPEPEPEPTPTLGQPAGGAAYAPRRREGPPRRISFLEQDIREKYERARELETLIKATEGRAREAQAEDIERRDLAAIRALSRSTEQLEAIRASIGVLELELQQLIAIQQDEDDAIAVILMAATLH